MSDETPEPDGEARAEVARLLEEIAELHPDTSLAAHRSLADALETDGDAVAFDPAFEPTPPPERRPRRARWRRMSGDFDEGIIVRPEDQIEP